MIPRDRDSDKFFPDKINAGVAQRQSNAFVKQRSWVQFPPSAPEIFYLIGRNAFAWQRSERINFASSAIPKTAGMV